MARRRNPRASFGSRLAAGHYRVSDRHGHEPVSAGADEKKHRYDDDERTSSPPRDGSGVSALETVAFVVALIGIVVLLALL